MDLSLSSSTPSTPIGKTSSVSSGLPTPPNTAPRKRPHCTKCHRPKAGHPRQGCPYTDSPEFDSPKIEREISDAFEYLQIRADVKPTRSHSPRRSPVKPTTVPEASLASLSTDASAILNGLLQPGMMDDNVQEDERALIRRWHDKIIVTPSKAGKQRMPGNLFTPSTTPSTTMSLMQPISQQLDATQRSNWGWERKPTIPMPGAFMTSATTKVPIENEDEDEDMESESLVSTQPVSVSSYTSSATSKHLMRSMSVEERHDFLDGLVRTSKAPPASVFVLPMGEIQSTEISATHLGFHCRTIDLGNGEGWLIMGMEMKAVEVLFTSVQGDASKKNGGCCFKAAAGGAVAGAVATWTALAFA